MKTQNQTTGAGNTTAVHLSSFTAKEDALIARLKAVKFDFAKMPERLSGWRIWIGDSAIYLNKLKTFVEDVVATTNRKAA